MSFAWPLVLPLLVIPLLLLLIELRRGHAQASQATHERILRGQAGRSSIQLIETEATRSPLRKRRLLLPCSLIFAILALARPQWGIIEDPVFEQSREILIGLDLSRSMLAEDIKPRRLDRAKLLVQSLIDHINGERIGLVVFSGTAFLQSPLSTDYEILRDLLPDLGPEFLPEGGTDYEKLLKTSLDSFSQDSAADRFLIILSDGEALDESWRDQMKRIKARKIRVIGLGIGTQTGAMVPDGHGGFVKNAEGAAVLSKIEPATLQELARETGGTYREASTWVDLPALINETIEKGRQGAFVEKRHSRKEDHYQWPLGVALVLAMLSIAIEFPARVRPRKMQLHGHAASRKTPPPLPKTAALLFLFGLGATLGQGELKALTVEPKKTTAGAPAPTPAPPSAATPVAPSTNPLPHLPNPSSLPKAQSAVAEDKEASKTPALVEHVKKFSSQDSLNASNCRQLAEATIEWGKGLRQAGQPVPPSVVRDGLEAVRLGESLNPSETDWKAARQSLEDLLNPKNQPPKQEENKKQEPKQDPKQDKQDKNDQQDKPNQDNKDQQKQDPKSSDSQDDKQDQNQKKDQKQDPQKPEDQKQQQDQSKQSQEDQKPKKEPTDSENAFKKMKDEKEKEQPQPAQPHAEEMQKVGGNSEKTPDKDVDPSLVAPLQKLEKLKEDDSPSRLFQLMEADPKKPKSENANKKNW